MGDEVTRIGILSDTHGRAEMAARAAGLFVRHGVTRAFHCGDIGSDSVIDALAGLRMTYVFGNTDYDRAMLRRYIAAVGATLGEPAARCEIGGRTIAVTHGDNHHVMMELLNGGVDYLCHGHTHECRDEHVGQTRIINPGALHRARQHTVAILDLESDELEFLAVN